jgi:hypothetical protein
MALQVPPFWQGDGLHGTYWFSQFWPVYPMLQLHLFRNKKLIKIHKKKNNVIEPDQ